MTATRADVNTKLAAAVTELEKTTSGAAQMVSKYGGDPAKWPTTSHWYKGFAAIAAAQAEVSLLADPATKPTAAFAYKEV